jgi:hypothetical protein
MLAKNWADVGEITRIMIAGAFGVNVSEKRVRNSLIPPDLRKRLWLSETPPDREQTNCSYPMDKGRS